MLKTELKNGSFFSELTVLVDDKMICFHFKNQLFIRYFFKI